LKNTSESRGTKESSVRDDVVVDVFSTVKQIGYPFKVLRDYVQKMNRYAFLLVE